MNLDEIKSAIKYIDLCFQEDKDLRIGDSIVFRESVEKIKDLATSVLNAEMPKEKLLYESQDGLRIYKLENVGYNQALKDCTLYTTRILLEKDELHDKAMEATRLNINAYRQELAKCKAENEKAREAFEEILSWIDGCYCLTEEEASKTGGKTCPNCIAKSFLEGR